MAKRRIRDVRAHVPVRDLWPHFRRVVCAARLGIRSQHPFHREFPAAVRGVVDIHARAERGDVLSHAARGTAGRRTPWRRLPQRESIRQPRAGADRQRAAIPFGARGAGSSDPGEHRQPEPLLPRLAVTREPRPAHADHRVDSADVRLAAGGLAARRHRLRLRVRRNRCHGLRAARSHRPGGGPVRGAAAPVRRRPGPVAQPRHRARLPHLPGAHLPAGRW